MLKNSPEKAARRYPGERACDDCNEYTAHMSHHGLVYQILYGEKGGYHRHIAHCPCADFQADRLKVN